MAENIQLLHCKDKSVNAAWENNSHLFRAKEINTDLYIKQSPPLSLGEMQKFLMLKQMVYVIGRIS